MLLAAGLAVALLAAAPAIAQEAKIEGGPSAKGGEKAEAKAAPGVEAKPGEAKAGGAEAKTEPCPEAKAGGAVAKAECPPPKEEAKAAPPPPPKMEEKAPPPPPPKEGTMPKTGGIAPTSGITAGLWGLGATALLVGGGLLARRMFAR
jgi:hypothetical protein